MEDNLVNGVNPLGRDTQQCYQVPTDMIYLYNKKGTNSIKRIISIVTDIEINATVLTNYIEEFVSPEARDIKKVDLEASLTEALERELEHFQRVRSFGRASQYNRNVNKREPFRQSVSCNHFFGNNLMMFFLPKCK